MRAKHPAAALAGLLSSALLAIGCAIPPAMASSQADIDDLTALIKKGGTEIVYIDCKDKSTAGKYSYSKKKKIDRLTICKDSFDPKDTDSHWEVLAHEAPTSCSAATAAPFWWPNITPGSGAGSRLRRPTTPSSSKSDTAMPTRCMKPKPS